MHKAIVYILIFLVIFIIQVIRTIIKISKSNTTNKYWSELKQNGSHIVVNFEDCEIKTREYYDKEPKEGMPTQIEMLDALSNRYQETQGVKKIVSMLRYYYKTPSGNTVEFRSDVINMPVERLRFLLDQKKQTTIFVDPENWNRYYFDLEFLR